MSNKSLLQRWMAYYWSFATVNLKIVDYFQLIVNQKTNFVLVRYIISESTTIFDLGPGNSILLGV